MAGDLARHPEEPGASRDRHDCSTLCEPYPTSMRRVLVVLALLTLLLSACGQAHGVAAAPPTRRPARTGPPRQGRELRRTSPLATPVLHWRTCDTRFQCATLPVPISYRDPALGTIPMAVVRLPAGDHRPGALDVVINPGGPGASGVSFLEQAWQAFPASLRERVNLVSFDPQGVGASEPVRCLSPAGLVAYLELPPAPTSPASLRRLVTATRSFVAGCERSVPADVLAHLATREVAKDMNRLREALGQSKLTYLGFSYGTYLGALYAEQFPTRVRAMVLDGAVDPALGTDQLDAEQAASFEHDLDAFFSWCQTVSAQSCPLRTTGAAAGYHRLIRELTAGRAIPADLPSGFAGPSTVDLGVAETGVLSALYSVSDWPDLARGIAGALDGDGEILAALALDYLGLEPNGTYSNIVSADTAVSCLDRPTPSSLAAYEALAKKLAAADPDFGAAEAWSTLACLYWPFRPVGRPAPIHAPGTPTILVVGSTGDPATPYSWAVALAEQLDHARLLTRDGDGHTAYFFSACIQHDVDAYLLDLSLPPAGTVCPSGFPSTNSGG